MRRCSNQITLSKQSQQLGCSCADILVWQQGTFSLAFFFVWKKRMCCAGLSEFLQSLCIFTSVTLKLCLIIKMFWHKTHQDFNIEVVIQNEFNLFMSKTRPNYRKNVIVDGDAVGRKDFQ